MKILDDTNVFLTSAYNLDDDSGRIQCGHMEYSYIKTLRHNLRNVKIPPTSCIGFLTTKLEDTISQEGPTTQMTISICPINKKCTVDDYSHCINHIVAGDCEDEFVINHIGKQLFAEKYAKQK